MTMSPQDLQRKVTQQGNDIDAIYEMLGTISMTQTHHGRRLNDVEAKIDGVDTRLTARLDGIDTRLGGIDTRLDGIDGRLDGISTDLAEVLRRLPG